MSIRLKLLVFLLAFLLITALFGLGSVYVFDKMTGNLELMNRVAVEHDLYEELKTSIIRYSANAKDWAYFGKKKYLFQYKSERDTILKNFGDVNDFVKDRERLSKVGKLFETLDSIASEIFSYRNPLGNAAVMHLIRQFDAVELKLLTTVEEMEVSSIDEIRKAVKESGDLKKSLSEYVAVVIFFTVLAFVFLILLITRSIGKPFRELLELTGDMNVENIHDGAERMGADEFGVIARRFGAVVDKLRDSEETLKKRLSETELLLEVTRIASSTLGLQDSLKMIAETVAKRMEFDYVAIYLLDNETMKFHLQASNDDVFEDTFEFSGDGMCGEMKTKPDGSEMIAPCKAAAPCIKDKIGALFAIPVIRDGICKGGLVVGIAKRRSFTGSEINVIRILAHSISTIIKNSELYTSAINQLNKITVLYELSNALTVVLDLDELLKKVSYEVSRLLSAKGCIIRMKEGDVLEIRAHHGIPAGIAEEMELQVGEGLAGKVAETGRALIVEDVAEMPDDVRVPKLKVKSVICIPLKIGDEVVGTLGLYDKMDKDGEIVSFGYDDLKTTEGFGYIVSLAIEKVRLFELHVKKEKEALEAKKRLDILFDSVQSGIVTLDRSYRILSVNRFIEEFLNLKAEEIIGKDAVRVFHDKGGICPHCVAKLTFETGDINLITQSKGANYAELGSYPVYDEDGKVSEAVVLVQDITDRVLYQEEIITLYREVAQTKEYLESLIDNSADAIVTTDLKGIVTSWNRGAERIYGFTEEEAMGAFLPFIPDFMLDTEMQYIERIMEGETIKDMEMMRKRKDGSMIEVSLTLSPIKDATGEVIGISGISRDISEKKKVEKELIRRNQELSRLFFISSAMRGTLEVERLLRMVLTAVTMSDGLGFNRAILFLINEEKGTLHGVMGVGPSTSDEAWQIWEQLSLEKKTLPEILREIDEGPLRKDSFLDRLSTGLEVPVKGERGLSFAINEKRSVNIKDARNDSLADPEIIQQLGSEAYAIVPLIARNKVIGVLWVDNYFNRKPITEEDMRFLAGFSDQVASAIESARLFEQVKLAEMELENIFESISDLLYITTEDYTIRNINKAVVEKVGRPKEEIIGRKCYEIFHGMDRPYERCPHHKTVTTRKAYIEEFEDPYRGGTMLTSTSPLFDGKGEFIGTVHIVRDITELQRLRERLSQAERMATLGEVAAKVAHEIRNPLVSIGGFSRRLEGKLEGQLKDYAAVITREVGRLEGILRDILSFVRDVRIKKENVQVVDILNEIISLYLHEIKKKGILLKTDYQDPLYLYIDPNRMKEALINIIGNAIQVLKHEDILRVRTYRSDGYGIIEVSDTGPGIEEKDLPFIFDPFFTTKIDGTGLGLAITHRIVEEHKGRIEVSSEKGKGTTFKIYLPCKIKTGGEEL